MHEERYTRLVIMPAINPKHARGTEGDFWVWNVLRVSRFH